MCDVMLIQELQSSVRRECSVSAAPTLTLSLINRKVITVVRAETFYHQRTSWM